MLALSDSVPYPATGGGGKLLHSSEVGALVFSAPGEAGFVHDSMPNEKGLHECFWRRG